MPHIEKKVQQFMAEILGVREKFQVYAYVIETALDLIGDDEDEYALDLRKIQLRIIASVEHLKDIEKQLAHALQEAQP